MPSLSAPPVRPVAPVYDAVLDARAARVEEALEAYADRFERGATEIRRSLDAGDMDGAKVILDSVRRANIAAYHLVEAPMADRLVARVRPSILRWSFVGLTVMAVSLVLWDVLRDGLDFHHAGWALLAIAAGWHILTHHNAD